jgi:hypothetical protein
VVPETVHNWFVLPEAHVQICILLPLVVAPLVTSKHLVPKTCRVDPEMVQFCEVEPPEIQSSISTAAPSVLDAAVKHFAELALGWMYVAAAPNKTEDRVRNKSGLGILGMNKYEDANLFYSG